MSGGINKLTATEVLRAKTAGYYGDGGGLWLQISPLGGKSWVLRYTSPATGKRREYGLGALHTFGLKEARDRAREAREQVERGVDPIEQRKAHRATRAAAEAKDIPTFRQCAKAVLERVLPGLSNPKHREQWQATLETYAYPKLGALPVGIITKHLVAEVLEPIWRTKHDTAKRLRGRLEAVFDYAKAKDYYSGENPAAWRGCLEPLLGRVKKSSRHQPSLPWAEVPSFVAELRQREGIAARALEFAILTAARSSESSQTKHGEIDLTSKLWTVPADRIKGRKEHTVPLSDDAVKLLRALPVIEGSDLVFPAPEGGALSDAALTAVIKRMHESELKDGRKGYVDPKELKNGKPRVVTTHGFRSSFRDWAGGETNHGSEVVEQSLAHKLKDKTVAAYQRGEYLAKRRRLMADWAKFCQTLPTKGDAKVADFETHKRKARK